MNRIQNMEGEGWSLLIGGRRNFAPFDAEFSIVTARWSLRGKCVKFQYCCSKDKLLANKLN